MKITTILLLFFSLSIVSFAQEANIWKKYIWEINNSNIPELPNYSYAGYKLGNESIPDREDLNVFNVIDYGAIANDSKSDFNAIKDAVDAAEKNKGGIIFFPPGEYLVNTQSGNNTPIIEINTGNIIFRGSGSVKGGTIINMKNHMFLPSGKNPWETPALFQFNGNGTGKRTKIVKDAKRNDFSITVNNARDFKNVKFVRLKMEENKAVNNTYLDNKKPRNIWNKINDEGISLQEFHEIDSVNESNNTLTFKDPIIDDINFSNDWEVRAVTLLENCGFEDIHFKGNFNKEFKHHKNYIHDEGWKFISMSDIAHSWVRRCRFSDVNKCISMESAYASSITSILVDGNRGHGISVVNNGSTRVLQGLIWDNTNKGMWHGTDMSSRACGSVVWRVNAPNGRGWDLHAAQPRTNLIDNYISYDLSGVGGHYSNNPNHLKGLTIWNQKRVGKTETNINLWNDCGKNYCGTTIVNPIIVGMHGSATTFKNSTIKYEEGNGKKMQPESLYEAQLNHRLGQIPAWLTSTINEYNTLVTDWYSDNPVTIAPTENEVLSVSFLFPNLKNQKKEPSLVAGASLQIEAVTSKNIKSVDLYINDILIRTEKFVPFEWGHKDDLDPELKELTEGTYNLKLIATNNDNSITEATTVLTVSNNTLSTIDFKSNNVTAVIYPNPITSNYVTIDLSKEKINANTIQIELYSIKGKLMQQTSHATTNQIKYYIPNSISNAVYFMVLKANKSHKTKQVIVNR
ncbi:DUF4955 domain-containing protein [Aquimarina agarilytica]|uniref:DUF4955 domain-containing protein n=1 Tax=Aquimarina agarilytica TaxID=1087449 RepID=UPI00028A26A8|nr:DUF4955 domain-containing protein [Aquimarina agarilytica]